MLTGFSLFVFLDLAQATLFCKLFFLTTNKFSLATGFFFATRKFSLVQDGRHHNGVDWLLGFSRLAFITLDEGSLLAHFDLNGAGFACGISLLDLAGGLFHQSNFFPLKRVRTMTGL